MAQLPCIGLSWPLTKPPFGSCAIYFHYGVVGKKVRERTMPCIFFWIVHDDVQLLQGGPLGPVINGVITPISRFISPQLPISAHSKGYTAII